MCLCYQELSDAAHRAWFLWKPKKTAKLLLILVYREPIAPEPCNPSPCGSNAVCKERNGAGSCACLPEYTGDPYLECRPECVLNSDCPKSKACVNNKCHSPCPGVCGRNAECHVANHAPHCNCFDGYTGNPSVACHEIPRSIYLFMSTVRFRSPVFLILQSHLQL